MFEIVSWIADQHNIWTVLAAVLICVSGSLLTMRLFSRVRRTQGLQSWNWLFLSGFVGGLTIWTTHFVSMLGCVLPATVGYDPLLTIMSLSIALITTIGGFAVASRNTQSLLVEVGGAIVGIGIAVMHFTGIAAYKASVHVEWDWRYAVAATAFGAAFGALATSRIARPVSRYCKYGGAAAFMLAVLFTHFTGMAGMTMTMDPTMAPLPELIRPSIMAALVCLVMLVVLALGTSTYIIDRQASQAATDRYRQLSLHDPLTNLPNRAAFNDHVSALMRRPKDTTARIAVLYFDLDRFNGINDVHGHAAGDAVLRVVAERLTMIMSNGEFVARIGGDEFVAFVDGFYMRGNARTLAERVIEEIGKPIEWNGQKLSVGCSVGISTDPAKVSDIDDLLAQANVAMGRAKSEAGSICFYDQSMDEAARKRSALAADMREGIHNGQFELAYQQQNDTASRAVVGFEVLLRWRHPTLGMVSPAEFIPIAEKTGFIREIGEWVLRTACAEAATWAQPIPIAVNVAPLQLADPQLPQRVHTILLETGFPASRLEIEITESSLIADQQVALHAIRRLKALGVKIAMDDYGTGYSSLSTLQSFPFDKIKIDRAFVTDLATSRQSAAIVRSTLILAASLDIPVLAEGVEYEEQIEFLRREGCAQVQGFLFGKPLARSGIEAIVNRDDAARNQRPEADIGALPQIADKAVAA